MIQLTRLMQQHNISLNMNPGYFIAEDSQNQSEEKIKEIIANAGFCPLISETKINNNFVFSFVPYKTPAFSKIYFKLEEIERLLECLPSIEYEKKEYIYDSEVNEARSHLSSAVVKGLAEIIKKNAKEEFPIVEIGSREGYNLPYEILLKTIRTQSSYPSFKKLKKLQSNGLYNIDIKNLVTQLVKSGKKIPLFFSFNSLDLLTSQEMRSSFSEISQLQDSGDRILIMIDTCPWIINKLKKLYPEHIPFPYLPLKDEINAKASVVLIPQDLVKGIPTNHQFLDMFYESGMSILKKDAWDQYQLHLLQKEHNLKIIVIEDFFAEFVKDNLEQSGYKSRSYYHAAFTVGMQPAKLIQIQQDLLYKSVTGITAIRQWSTTDDRLISWLESKSLHLPSHFNEDFLNEMRAENKKILGAEMLVIEGVKI